MRHPSIGTAISSSAQAIGKAAKTVKVSARETIKVRNPAVGHATVVNAEKAVSTNIVRLAGNTTARLGAVAVNVATLSQQSSWRTPFVPDTDTLAITTGLLRLADERNDRATTILNSVGSIVNTLYENGNTSIRAAFNNAITMRDRSVGYRREAVLLFNEFVANVDLFNSGNRLISRNELRGIETAVLDAAANANQHSIRAVSVAENLNATIEHLVMTTPMTSTRPAQTPPTQARPAQVHMHVSEAGIRFLFGAEGFRRMPYVGIDVENITIGYGHAFIGGVNSFYSDITSAEHDAIRRSASLPSNQRRNVYLNNERLMRRIRANLHNDFRELVSSSGLWLTEPEANSLARHSIAVRYGNAINVFLERNPNVQITQYQFDALVSFTYQHGPAVFTNRGDGTFGYTMRNFLIVGDFSEEATREAFMTYTTTPRRREQEALLFSTGRYY